MSKGMAHEPPVNKTVEWYTPKYIFNALDITFDLDPCSPGKDIVPWVPAIKHYTPAEDGLMLPWSGNVWMNPPYGKNTVVWLERLALHGNGVALLFVRTDASWFHRFVPRADAICFVKGRIAFVAESGAKSYVEGSWEPKASPGAGSMLIAYGKDNAAKLSVSKLGMTLPIPDRPII
jgi:hypothetical protein